MDIVKAWEPFCLRMEHTVVGNVSMIEAGPSDLYVCQGSRRYECVFGNQDWNMIAYGGISFMGS